MKEAIVIGFAAVIIIAIALLASAALIWSVNTLFVLAIPYTWKTLLAALLLGGLFSSGATTSKRK